MKNRNQLEAAELEFLPKMDSKPTHSSSDMRLWSCGASIAFSVQSVVSQRRRGGRRVQSVAALLASLLLLASAASGGIPEPGIILYGVVTDPTTGTRITSGTLEIIYTDSFGKSITNSVPLQNLGNAYSFVTEMLFESPVSGFAVTASDVFELPTNGAPARVFSRSAKYDNASASLPQGTNDSISYQQKGKLQRMDLVIAPVDSDHDGMPDYWERQYFGNLLRDGTGDSDGDGVIDWMEYVGGTDPNDPQSFFRLTFIEKSVSGITIRWRGPTGRTFSVLQTTNLSEGFLPVMSGVLGTNGEAAVTMPDTGSGAEFFRVRGD